jgi:ABC-2 type transporter
VDIKLNPICMLSDFLNQDLIEHKKIQFSTQRRVLVSHQSYLNFIRDHFLEEWKLEEELAEPESKFRENFFRCFLLVAKRIILFTVRDFYAFSAYLITILILCVFGCILFIKLDGIYIERGSTPEREMTRNIREIHNRIGSVVYLLSFTYFLVMSNTSYKMVRENKIVFKELNAGLYRFPNFFLPKNVIDFLFLLIPVLICVFPVSVIRF